MGSSITKSKTAAKAAEESTKTAAKPKAAEESSHAKDTVTVKADKPNDLNEKGSQLKPTQDGTEAENKTENLEKLRAIMKSYKALYDAGEPLPEGTNDDFYSDYEQTNKSQVVDWMVEYSVPEIYLQTFQATTYTTWLGAERDRITPFGALNNLYCLCETSITLAERLLEVGYLNYFVSTVTDQQFLENYEDNKAVLDVILPLIVILHDCVQLIPDHTAYKQLDVTQALKPYLSSGIKDVKTKAMLIISKVASTDEYEQITESELETLRARMEMYKALYDAGQILPQGTDDNFYPYYVKENNKAVSQIVEWMVEYCVPEIYLKTLESTTYTTWMAMESVRKTAWHALDNLCCLCETSKILAERLLELGYVNYFEKHLTDHQYLENYSKIQVLTNVLNRMIFILHDCVALIPDHTAYKQLDITQALKPYLLSDNKDIQTSVMTVISKVASKEQYEQITQSELERLKVKMQSYKEGLYGTGQPLPQGTDDRFYPSYVKENKKNKSQVVDWMLEYCVPEVYLTTLEATSCTTWLSDKSVRETPWRALDTLYCLCDSSKILSQRLLDLGYLNYFVKHLTDQEYLENYKDNQVVLKVIHHMVLILDDCVKLVPDHPTYKQLDIAQALKPYLSAENKEIIPSIMSIISKVSSEDQYEQIKDSELEKLRATMESYKELYDAGQKLPKDADGYYDGFNPCYVKENFKIKSKIVEWMVEYCVPEVYLKTLEDTTYTTWLDESARQTPWKALSNLFFIIESSKTLAHRLLELGYLKYFAKNLTDEQYLDNYEDDQAVLSVIVRMTDILNDCVQLVPDHTAYQQLDITQTLRPYLSGGEEAIKDNVMRILLKVASKEQYEQITHSELEKLRAKMESYKVLYDAGEPLPKETEDEFYPEYVKENSKFKSELVNWMLEYSVPEIYLKTLESTTYTTWLGEESIRVTPSTALKNLYSLIESSKILAERMLDLGYVKYFVKNLTDPQYLENHKDNVAVYDVLDNIISIIESIVKLVPDHVSYKQQDLAEVLKRYMSTDFKCSALNIIIKVGGEEESSALVNAELEEIRVKMESYKELYDAGDSLSGGSEYDIWPDYLSCNKVYQTKVQDWMLQYKVLELYIRTLEKVTSSVIRRGESISTTCRKVLGYLQNATFYSTVVSKTLMEVGYMQYFMNILTDPELTEYQHESRTEDVVRCCIQTLLNCVRCVPGHFLYKELKLNEVMKSYLSNENMVLRATAMMIYSTVIEENDSKQLDDSGCIPFMINGINEAIHDINRFFESNGNFHINELLECVNRVAANDANKIKLVDAGLLPLLVMSLQTGEEQEQENSAKLTWTLCFDDNIREKVVKEPNLVKELERLSESSNDGVQKAAKGALWKVSGEEKHQQQSSQQTHENKHIFISYQWDNQQMILQLNQRLKADGYKTWIDVDQMGGSTLDAMAGAVENAALVLICASEKYKLSPNCRTEGEYTYQRGKPLVPLMMQRRYKPDGWLGMLMGVKLYINFDGKYEFDKAYQMLMKEMTPILKVSTKPDSAVVPQASSISQSVTPTLQAASQPAAFITPSIATWNNQQVLVWATKHKLTKRSSEFDSMLKSMDGTQLVNFSEMKTEAPEFFYKMMKEDYKLDMMAIISLKIAMKDLE